MRQREFLEDCRAVAILTALGIPALAVAEGDVPFVPTPHETVRAMLEAADVQPDDLVIDLGSGDGRIVIAAARDFGARAIGVELNDDLLEQSRQNAQRAGVGENVEFLDQDLFETDLRPASVLTMYLLPGVNLELRDKILRQMRPGARVVSHDFAMGDWEPDATVEVGSDTVYLWIVPARVEGAWSLTLPTEQGPQQAFMKLEQSFQNLRGELISNGQSLPIERAIMVGDAVWMELTNATVPAQPLRFQGRVNGSKIIGVLEGQPLVLSRADT
jgi:precorrin-6B methylase 2